MLKTLKIHALSLGIGAAVAIVAIIIIFFTFGSVLTSNTPAKANMQTSDEKALMLELVNNTSPILGTKDAQITMIEFGDYQCFYCNNFFHNTESSIMQNYISTGKVKMFFKDFTIIGQDSVNAANAAHCAQEKGKFWEYHDILYNNWSGENTGWASSKNLLTFAKQVGLDESDFNTCMSTGKYISVIRGSLSDAQSLGLTGTPDFFIIAPDNTITKVVGAQPYSAFDEIFKSKLKT